MRVTQYMLTNSNLKYISQNYERLGKYQDQLNTGKKITRPSDDPVIAMKGMRYRSQLVEVKQYYRNLTEGYTWLETSDSALDESGQILHRIRELTVQASNDSYDKGARENIAKEITQLQEHLVAMANTKVGDNYIFNGTNTDNPPVNANQFNVNYDTFKNDFNAATSKAEEYVISYQGQTYKYDDSDGKFKYTSLEGNVNTLTFNPGTDEFTLEYKEDLKYQNGNQTTVSKVIDKPDEHLVFSHKSGVSNNDQDVEIEVMKGVNVAINVRPDNAETFAFSTELFSGLESIKKMLVNPNTTGQEITKALDSIDKFQDNIVSTRAELGARLNRVEMVEDRLLKQRIVAEQTVADNEDVDFEEAIINLTIQESLHRAALAVGARIIQPTLMDFLR